MTTPFEDFLYEEACIAAAELVGPNDRDYEHIVESFLEDPLFEDNMRHRYAMQTGEQP